MFDKFINLKKFNNRFKNIFSNSKNKVEDVTVYDLVDSEKNA